MYTYTKPKVYMLYVAGSPIHSIFDNELSRSIGVREANVFKYLVPPTATRFTRLMDTSGAPDSLLSKSLIRTPSRTSVCTFSHAPWHKCHRLTLIPLLEHVQATGELQTWPFSLLSRPGRKLPLRHSF